MREFDETDLEIVRMLGEDARRPFSEIGEAVGLSGPAVSNRVTRLREAGVIEGFTIDVDRSQLRAGVPVFVRVEASATSVEEVTARVGDEAAVEHVFVTADGDCWFSARVAAAGVRRWLDGLFADVGDVEYAVTLLDSIDWRPSLSGVEFAIACAECGNTVDSEGESAGFGGEVYHFCCPSCRNRFADRYERLDADA